MEFYEVLRTRRSVRSFKTDKVPVDVLKRVLNVARVTPSGRARAFKDKLSLLWVGKYL